MPKKIDRDLPELKLTDNKTIGERISAIRKEKGFSQLQLTEKLGIARGLLSDYEVGRSRIYGEMITRIAIALNVSADRLLGLDIKEDKPSKSVSLKYTKRIKEIEALPDNKKKVVLRALDDMIKVLNS